MNNIDKNVNLFQYLINVDSYIYEYLHIIYLKKNKNLDKLLLIESYYLNFFKQIINDINIKQTSIITIKDISYKYLINNEFISKINKNYLDKSSISYLYLYYIIINWDSLPENIFFYNENNENIFPLEMYIIPKNNIGILANNHQIFNLNNNDIILSKKEKNNIKQVTNLSFKSWWDRYIKKKLPEVFEYCPELTFSVRRENIKRNSREYYINIFNYIHYRPYCKEIYYLDRCWYYILL